VTDSLCHASRIVDSGVLVATFNIEEIRDAPMAYALRDELISLVSSAAARHLVIDARNVAFISSIGFLAFLGVRRHLSHGRIILCELREPVLQMFEACRLIPTPQSSGAPFEVAATLQEAVDRLG